MMGLRWDGSVWDGGWGTKAQLWGCSVCTCSQPCAAVSSKWMTTLSAHTNTQPHLLKSAFVAKHNLNHFQFRRWGTTSMRTDKQNEKERQRWSWRVRAGEEREGAREKKMAAESKLQQRRAWWRDRTATHSHDSTNSLTYCRMQVDV